jgi:quinol monooxygenase YgiN
MIHVIASISVHEGKMQDALNIYELFVPKVNAEDGCLQYLPTRDLPTDIPTQVQEGNVITVLERWESMDAFKAHLTAPHVVQFRKDVESIVAKVSIKVLTNVGETA